MYLYIYSFETILSIRDIEWLDITRYTGLGS